MWHILPAGRWRPPAWELQERLVTEERALCTFIYSSVWFSFTLTKFRVADMILDRQFSKIRV